MSVFLALPAQANDRACFALFAQTEHSFSSPDDRDAVQELKLDHQFHLTNTGGQTSLLAQKRLVEGNDAAFYSVHLQVAQNVDPRVKDALSQLGAGLRLSLERTVTREAGQPLNQANQHVLGSYREEARLTPRFSTDAIIDIPWRALETNDTLASFLESLIPIAREHVRQLRLEENTKAVAKIDPATKALLTRWFETHDVRVVIKQLASDTLGASSGKSIFIDEGFARYPIAVGTAIHEIFHTTVTSKLTSKASVHDVGRAMWFELKSPQVRARYASLFRADEYEARRKQLAALRVYERRVLNRDWSSEITPIEKQMQDFRTEETFTCELFLNFFDQVKVKTGQNPSDPKLPVLIASLEGDSISIPLVKPVTDARAYVQDVITKRVEALKAITKTERVR